MIILIRWAAILLFVIFSAVITDIILGLGTPLSKISPGVLSIVVLLFFICISVLLEKRSGFLLRVLSWVIGEKTGNSINPKDSQSNETKE